MPGVICCADVSHSKPDHWFIEIQLTGGKFNHLGPIIIAGTNACISTPLPEPTGTTAWSSPSTERHKACQKKDYVLLAKLLLQNDPTECTRRSVEFLIGICNGLEPDAVPPIKWLEEEPAVLGIQLGAPSAFSRVAPVMRLRATIR